MEKCPIMQCVSVSHRAVSGLTVRQIFWVLEDVLLENPGSEVELPLGQQSSLFGSDLYLLMVL